MASEVNFYASKVEKKGDIVEADSDVLIFSELYYISANKAIYNETSKDVELFGDINILRGKNERFNSCYAKVNLVSDEAEFKNFFFADNKIEVWFQSEQSDLNNTVFIGKNSIVSSCNVQNPDWQIRFSSGELNRENNYLHLYNAKLYVKSVPVFYLPYLGFNVDNSRRTGFLIPEFEANREDGFFYRQPFYVAFSDEWDLEYAQQVRANRGLGGYATFRFMDSAHSSGQINVGFFRERTDYFEEKNLKNQTHQGIELKYSRQNFIKNLFNLKDDFQEGLWVDGTYLNDVDYLNLERRDYRDLTSLITSKFNYFLADENNYYAIYANYYIDTSKVDNQDTLQEYPSFQYHKFLDGIFANHLQYSFDANFNRYYRDVGVYANITNLNLPLTYHTKLFDDFLQFSFSEKLYSSFVNYTNYNKEHEQLFRNYHEFSLYTDLSKPYDNFYHTVYFGANYLLKGARSGLITQNFLSVEDETERLNLKAVQYFYNASGEKKIKHRLNLNYDSSSMTVAQIQNSTQYFINQNIWFSNEATYSDEQHRFTKVISALEFNTQKINFNLSHAYKYDASEYANLEIPIQKYNFINTKVDYTHNINYKFFSGAWFDTQRANLNAWEVGYTYQRKCWNYSLIYKERIDPQLTSAGIKARVKNGLYFVFNFYPIGGVSYDLSLQENENAVSGI